MKPNGSSLFEAVTDLVTDVTLLNATAHTNYVPYQNFTHSTIWSWASSEPRNISTDPSRPNALYSCATANPSLAGRWAVADCSQKYFAACRANGQPYNWTISMSSISYSVATQACPKSYQFAVPRTALENSYLGLAVRRNARDYDGNGVLVDLNSLDTRGCWVRGVNSSCPYDGDVEQADKLAKQKILVCDSLSFSVARAITVA